MRRGRGCTEGGGASLLHLPGGEAVGAVALIRAHGEAPLLTDLHPQAALPSTSTRRTPTARSSETGEHEKASPSSIQIPKTLQRP